MHWRSCRFTTSAAEVGNDRIVAFVTGDGVDKPKGFLAYATATEGTQTWGQIGTVASGAAGAFASASPVDKLIDLIYAPKAQYRPNGRFVMNRRTVSAV